MVCITTASRIWVKIAIKFVVPGWILQEQLLKTEFGDKMFITGEERKQMNYDAGSSGVSNAFQKVSCWIVVAGPLYSCFA